MLRGRLEKRRDYKTKSLPRKLFNKIEKNASCAWSSLTPKCGKDYRLSKTFRLTRKCDYRKHLQLVLRHILIEKTQRLTQRFSKHKGFSREPSLTMYLVLSALGRRLRTVGKYQMEMAITALHWYGA